MALRISTSHNRRAGGLTGEASQPGALMQRNRGNLGKVFDAAAGAKPGEPAALMGLRRFLQFLSDTAVVPRLLAPAEVAANVVSDATTGQRARDGWKLSFNEFIGRTCLVAELAFRQRHNSDEARQCALLEYLAPSIQMIYGVTLELHLPTVANARASVYKPSSNDDRAELLSSPQSSSSLRVSSAGQAESLVRKLQRRLVDAERQLRSELKAREATEEELTRLRTQSVSSRQKEQVLRALSPRGLHGHKHGRAVLGVLAVGIIARSRVNATAGWFQLWIARVREAEMQRIVIVDRQRADTAVQEAEEALTTLTFREERRQDRSHAVPAEVHSCNCGPSRSQAGPSELAISAAKAETEAWHRRAEGETKARVIAERERNEERDALRNALASLETEATRAEQAERKAQKAVADCALLEKQLHVEVESKARREVEAARQLAAAHESARASHSHVVAALQNVAAELREELRSSELEVERQFGVCNRIAAQSGRRWWMWRTFSRWQTLAFICEAKAVASQQKVLLVAVLLHQHRRAQLRRRAFGAWSSRVRDFSL
jgi:flagellar biosynthesis GTPase FlhF